MLPLFLVSLGLSPALADVVAKGPPVSGDIVGGFRVLNVTDGSQGVNLTVYRGDYIKFKLADPTTEPVLAIPDLSIRQRLPGNLDEAPYFKMEKSGVFPFVLGTAKGSISVVDYRQANYQEVTPKEAAELIRNIAPLVLDVPHPGRIQPRAPEGLRLDPAPAAAGPLAGDRGPQRQGPSDLLRHRQPQHRRREDPDRQRLQAHLQPAAGHQRVGAREATPSFNDRFFHARSARMSLGVLCRPGSAVKRRRVRAWLSVLPRRPG
ncbi:MAG: hypothetical protein MZV70_60730 [Desulfobacterales bacterium]|nr:hypothetical protein [Desulfobacterales bacterium]